MDTFVIMLTKVPKVEISKDLIGRHVEHLRKLDDSGHLVLCGPFTDAPYGMIVVRARDKDEAVLFAQSDPFVTEKAKSFEVRTWRLANRENNYLG